MNEIDAFRTEVDAWSSTHPEICKKCPFLLEGESDSLPRLFRCALTGNHRLAQMAASDECRTPQAVKQIVMLRRRKHPKRYEIKRLGFCCWERRPLDGIICAFGNPNDDLEDGFQMEADRIDDGSESKRVVANIRYCPCCGSQLRAEMSSKKTDQEKRQYVRAKATSKRQIVRMKERSKKEVQE